MKELGLPGKGKKLAGMAVTSEHPSEVNKKIMNFFFIKKLCDFPFPRACSLLCTHPRWCTSVWSVLFFLNGFLVCWRAFDYNELD